MGCHTWFYSNKLNLKKQLTCEFHDVFREIGYPENILNSLEETLKYIKDNNCIKFEFTDDRLKQFWSKYPNGKIEFS